MQQKYHVGNIENSNLLMATVLLYHDWMKSCSTKEISLETNYYYIFSQKHVVYRLMYSQYENPDTLIWGKRNFRRTIEGCLVFKWIVT